MKTKTTKTISALLLLGSTLAFGTGNDSLYMGNVGRINPSISQILIGEVQVSGIQSPTKLTLDLLLSNGSLYTVNNILYQNSHLLWCGDRLGLVILNKSDWVQHWYRHLRKNIRGTFQKIHSQEETGLPNVPAVYCCLIDSFDDPLWTMSAGSGLEPPISRLWALRLTVRPPCINLLLAIFLEFDQLVVDFH